MPQLNPKIAAATIVNGLALVPTSDPQVVELVFVDADGNQQGGAAFGFAQNEQGIYAMHRLNPGPAFLKNEQNQVFITGTVAP